MAKKRGLLMELCMLIAILILPKAMIVCVIQSKPVPVAQPSNLNSIGKGIFMYADVPAGGIFPSSPAPVPGKVAP